MMAGPDQSFARRDGLRAPAQIRRRSANSTRPKTLITAPDDGVHLMQIRASCSVMIPSFNARKRRVSTQYLTDSVDRLEEIRESFMFDR